MLLETVLAFEAFNPPCRVDQALLACIKRVAARTDFDVKLAGGGAGFEGVSARAGYYAAVIFRMNRGFHVIML